MKRTKIVVFLDMEVDDELSLRKQHKLHLKLSSIANQLRDVVNDKTNNRATGNVKVEIVTMEKNNPSSSGQATIDAIVSGLSRRKQERETEVADKKEDKPEEKEDKDDCTCFLCTLKRKAIQLRTLDERAIIVRNIGKWLSDFDLLSMNKDSERIDSTIRTIEPVLKSLRETEVILEDVPDSMKIGDKNMLLTKSMSERP